MENRVKLLFLLQEHGQLVAPRFIVNPKKLQQCVVILMVLTHNVSVRRAALNMSCTKQQLKHVVKWECVYVIHLSSRKTYAVIRAVQLKTWPYGKIQQKVCVSKICLEQ